MRQREAKMYQALRSIDEKNLFVLTIVKKCKQIFSGRLKRF